MELPEGYTSEQEVLKVIDDAVIPLANHFTFGYFDLDDMIQEGRMLAIGALPKYDPQRGMTLKSFLTMHVRNRFITLQRNKLTRQQPPCILCKSKADEGCIKYSDKSKCDKWCSWRERNMAKRALMETYDNDNVIGLSTTAMKALPNLSASAEDRELIEMISDEIPLELRSDYLRYKDGSKLSKTRTQHIEAAIIEILGDLVQDGK